jgi:DNA processing protein
MSRPARLLRGRAGWPERLGHLGPTEPAELWIRGCRPLDELCAWPCVAIVGSRRPTMAGLVFTRRLAKDLARAGVAVVSGLALGIDAAAHAGALDGGGRTIAVLGCGIDRLYPRRNERLGERVEAEGAVVSEWAPGVEPAPWRFPVRNRLIAALTDATLVVEATLKSGSLITVDHALALGREVLAVPGAAWTSLGEGVNKLLRDGAVPITGVHDVLDALGIVEPERASTAAAPGGLPGRVWNELRSRPARPDMLALELGVDAAALAAALAELDLAGLLVTEPNGVLGAMRP